MSCRALAALRSVAKTWMQRLAEFRPHLEGAVWRGTATRHNDIHLQLFCDDPKSAQIRLLNLGVDFSVGSTAGMRADSVDVLSFASPCTQLETHVMLHLAVHDLDDLRGALRPDGTGRARRGDLAALCKLEGQQ